MTQMIGIRVPTGKDADKLRERLRRLAYITRLQSHELLERWIVAEEKRQEKYMPKLPGFAPDTEETATASAAELDALKKTLAEVTARLATLEEERAAMTKQSEAEPTPTPSETNPTPETPSVMPTAPIATDEAAAVERIMQLHNEGMSIRKITEALDAEGFTRTVKGKMGKWEREKIRSVINSKKS